VVVAAAVVTAVAVAAAVVVMVVVAVAVTAVAVAAATKHSVCEVFDRKSPQTNKRPPGAFFFGRGVRLPASVRKNTCMNRVCLSHNL